MKLLANCLKKRPLKASFCYIIILMKKFWFGIMVTALIAAVVVLIFGNSAPRDYMVVATNFPAYDFARAVVGEENVKMILPPGSDVHHFEPSPQDIVAIENAKLLVYNGGESEEWVEDLLGNRPDGFNVKMMDLFTLLNEAPVEAGDTAEDEYDEHIWTSPKNASKIITGIAEAASQIWPKHTETYQQNSERYISELSTIDGVLREVVSDAHRKTLVFGDRFPFLYFVKEYGLDFEAAFPGCAEETEADAKTLTRLIDYVKKHQIPVVLKVDLSSGSIAETIAHETGAKVLTLNSAHTATKDDFAAHKTYLDLMRENIQVIKEALK